MLGPARDCCEDGKYDVWLLLGNPAVERPPPALVCAGDCESLIALATCCRRCASSRERSTFTSPSFSVSASFRAAISAFAAAIIAAAEESEGSDGAADAPVGCTCGECAAA